MKLGRVEFCDHRPSLLACKSGSPPRTRYSSGELVRGLGTGWKLRQVSPPCWLLASHFSLIIPVSTTSHLRIPVHLYSVLYIPVPGTHVPVHKVPGYPHTEPVHKILVCAGFQDHLNALQSLVGLTALLPAVLLRNARGWHNRAF